MAKGRREAALRFRALVFAVWRIGVRQRENLNNFGPFRLDTPAKRR
jgi:hypothetical protein